MSKLTKRALAEATKELLKEKDINKITVKEITERIDMTRNTFYYHFTDVYDVLNFIILDEAEMVFNAFPNADDWETAFRTVLNFMHENKKMINHIYTSVNHLNLEHYIRDVVGNYTARIINIMAGADVDKQAKDIVTEFYNNGFVGVITNWIETDMKTPPEELAVICDTMLKGTIDSTIASAEKAVENLKKL